MTVAGGRVVSRPMNGAIEGMLAVLEDPRAEQADAAVAGLVDRYYREGPDALRPFKARFRKMLSDRDPGVRRVAAWALAHTGDLDVVPALIDALDRPRRRDVVDAARLGLQLSAARSRAWARPARRRPNSATRPPPAGATGTRRSGRSTSTTTTTEVDAGAGGRSARPRPDPAATTPRSSPP